MTTPELETGYKMETQKATAAALVAAVDFTGGTVGGVANVLVGQPLDTIKVDSDSDIDEDCLTEDSSSSEEEVKLQTYPHLYRSSFQCFVRTLQTEGVTKGLYRGTIPSLAANVAENSVLFCAYGLCQTGISKATGTEVAKLSTLQNATAGFGAAFFSSLALCPTELIKCRLQTLSEATSEGRLNTHKTITPWQLTRQIIKEHGLSGLFRGLTSTMAREMPGYFMFFGGYELTRSLLLKPGQSKDDLGVLQTIVAGGTGGCCFWLSVFPADVAKSRIQVLSHNQNISFLSTIRSILKHEGVSALYKGIGPTLLRTFPSTAALFVMYEFTKNFLSSAVMSQSVDEQN